MPDINTERIGIAFDMNGCPNRCRHCWLGPASERTMTAEDVRWGAQRFREYIENDKAGFKKLTVATSFREPDFTDDYRRLYALEEELSDGPPARFELLSIWRLARDDGYAEWAKSVGTDTCQVTFFGLEATNDWFHRRRGAFADALSATDRLLKAGVKPRWQLFLSTKALPELVDFTVMVERLELKKRVQELGTEFDIFAHLPGPDFEGRKIESLRPTVEQLREIPDVLTAATRKHFERQTLWEPEGTLYSQILNGSTDQLKAAFPEMLWFFVCSNYDVYSNVGTLEPWWRLGNLKVDSVEAIIRRFTDDRSIGLQVLFHKQPGELAQAYGNPEGQKAYSNNEDLMALWRGKYCQGEWERHGAIAT